VVIVMIMMVVAVAPVVMVPRAVVMRAAHVWMSLPG
jgi:hypothetical protein